MGRWGLRGMQGGAAASTGQRRRRAIGRTVLEPSTILSKVSASRPTTPRTAPRTPGEAIAARSPSPSSPVVERRNGIVRSVGLAVNDVDARERRREKAGQQGGSCECEACYAAGVFCGTHVAPAPRRTYS